MAQLWRIIDLQMGPRENEAMNRYYIDNPHEEVFSAVDVAEAFFFQHVDLVRLIQTNEWNHLALYAEDLLEPANNVLATIVNGEGGVNSDTTPASNAWSFAMRTVGPTIKRGGKRIPGVAESWTEDEVAVGAVPLDRLAGIAVSLLLPILVNGFALNPAVVRPQPLVNPTSYLVSTVIGAIYRQIGTQVSRKLSRGGGTSVGSLIAFSSSNIAGVDYSGFAEAQLDTIMDDKLADRPAVAVPYEVSRLAP